MSLLQAMIGIGILGGSLSMVMSGNEASVRVARSSELGSVAQGEFEALSMLLRDVDACSAILRAHVSQIPSAPLFTLTPSALSAPSLQAPILSIALGDVTVMRSGEAISSGLNWAQAGVATGTNRLTDLKQFARAPRFGVLSTEEITEEAQVAASGLEWTLELHAQKSGPASFGASEKKLQIQFPLLAEATPAVVVLPDGTQRVDAYAVRVTGCAEDGAAAESVDTSLAQRVCEVLGGQWSAGHCSRDRLAVTSSPTFPVIPSYSSTDPDLLGWAASPTLYVQERAMFGSSVRMGELRGTRIEHRGSLVIDSGNTSPHRMVFSRNPTEAKRNIIFESGNSVVMGCPSGSAFHNFTNQGLVCRTLSSGGAAPTSITVQGTPCGTGKLAVALTAIDDTVIGYQCADVVAPQTTQFSCPQGEILRSIQGGTLDCVPAAKKSESIVRALSGTSGFLSHSFGFSPRIVMINPRQCAGTKCDSLWIIHQGELGLTYRSDHGDPWIKLTNATLSGNTISFNWNNNSSSNPNFSIVAFQ